MSCRVHVLMTVCFFEFLLNRTCHLRVHRWYSRSNLLFDRADLSFGKRCDLS